MNVQNSTIARLKAELELAHKEHIKIRNHLAFQFEVADHYHKLLKEAHALAETQDNNNKEPTLGDYLHASTYEENIRLRQANETKDHQIKALGERIEQLESVIARYQDDINKLIVNYERRLKDERRRRLDQLYGFSSCSDSSDSELASKKRGFPGRVKEETTKKFVVKDITEL